MKKRIIAGLALAGTFAIAAPMVAHAWGGGCADGPRAEARHERGGPGMHGKHGYAHHGHARHGGGEMQMGRAMMADLALTDAQRKQLSELREAQRPAMREQATALREANQALRKLGFSGDYDEAKARELGERAATASAALAVLRAKGANDFYQVLTPEQRQKFSEQMSRYEERRQQRRGPRGEGPRGQGDGPARTPAGQAGNA